MLVEELIVFMTNLDVLNPVADSLEHHVDPAPRDSALDGKRIGLYWNLKAGGNFALDRIEQVLGERYPAATFTRHHGSVGWIMRHATPEDVATISADVDVLIGTSAD
jgi:hypothetical protein